jgi:hypothetical protein
MKKKKKLAGKLKLSGAEERTRKKLLVEKLKLNSAGEKTRNADGN